MEDDYTPEGNSGRSGRVKPSLAHLYYMLTACNGFRIYYKSKSAFFIYFFCHKELVAVQTSRSFDLYCHTNFCCFISGMSLIAWQFFQPSAGFFLFFVFSAMAWTIIGSGKGMRQKLLTQHYPVFIGMSVFTGFPLTFKGGV